VSLYFTNLLPTSLLYISDMTTPPFILLHTTHSWMVVIVECSTAGLVRTSEEPLRDGWTAGWMGGFAKVDDAFG
jgi:hypothetical protein